MSTQIAGSTSGATITTGTINASGSEGVTINAGTVGGISVGDIGGITPLGSVTITGGNSSSVLPNTITTNNGQITLNKSFNLNQSLVLTTNGGAIDASTSSLTTSSPITVTTSGGAVSLGTVQSSQPITITASGGDVNLGSNISAGTISVTGGSVTAATTKSTQSTTITASGGAINLGSTTSSGPIGISTTGSGTVTLTSTNSSGQLTLTTASGDINSGTIQSGQSTVIITTTGNVNLNTTTSSGALNITTSGGSASLTGSTQASGAINITTSGGSATLGNTQSSQSITVATSGGNASLNGPNQASGAINVTTGAGFATLGTINSAQSITVTTTSGNASLTGPTQASGAINVTTGTGSATLGTTNSAQSITVTTSGGNVNLDTTTQISGAIDVNITAGTGSATLGTTNSAQSITVTTSGGDVNLDTTTQISGAIDITTGGGSATLGTTELAQSITVTTSGGNASLDTTTQILGPIAVTTGGGSATLGTTDILGSITVTTGGGSATLTLTETPESITITTAGGAVTLGSTQSSQPFTISAGTGAISAGIVTMLTSFGTFTTSSGGSLNFQNITTESAAITISPVPIDLKTNGLLSSVISGTGADITLSTVDGSLDSQGAEIAPSFTVNAGIGVLTVGTIGGSHPLGKITISAASDFALPSISTANQSIVINPSILLSQDAILTTIFGSGTGGSITLPSVNGSAHNLTLTAGNQFVQTGALSNLGAISISGAAVTLSGAVTGESLTINNSGLLSLLSGSVSLSSIFSQTGTGETDLSQNISASSISFTGPLVLEAAVSLTATSSSFSAASVSGNFGLTVLASSDITIASLDVTATSLTSTTGSINITGSIVSGVTTLTASAGPISVGGDVTVSSLTVIAEGNVSIVGSTKFTENSSITSNSGQVLVGSVSSLSDFTVMANELISTGAISVSGLNLDSVASSISTGTLTVTSTATLTAGTSITVTSIAASDGEMSAGTFITILGDAAIANQLNMTASAGAILIQGSVEAAVGDFEATEGITVSGALFKVDEATLLATGGNILLPQVLSSVSFDATVNGGSFSSGIFNAGEATFDIFGSMTVNGTVFVDSTLTVTNVNGLTITGITNVDQLILGDGPGNLSGTMVFQGPVTIQQLTTVAQNYGVTFLNGGEIFSATTFNNTGEVTLQSGTNGILVFDGALVSNALPTTVLGQIATTVGGMTFQSLNVLSGGSSLITAGGDIEVMGATALNGNASFVTLGGDLTFDSTVEGPGGLLVSASPGIVTFDQTIGFGTALAYLTAVDIGRVDTKGVKAIGTINMGSPIILTNAGNNIFQSEGLITLGDIDGTTSGFQDLTLLAGTGGVNLGNVGQIIPIDTFLISTGTQALIKSIQTEGTIEIDINTVLAETQGGVITLNTNGGTSLGDDITLNLIDGSILGQQGLILNGGSLGDVFLQKNVGSTVPIASLEVRGASLSIEGALMSITGNQNYYPPTVIYPNLAVFTTFGNVTFYSSLDMTSDLSSLIFYMGGGSFTLLGNTGNSHMGNLSVLNSGAFSSQQITGNSLRVGGGRSIITLNSTVELSGLAGIILDGGPIFLGGEIDATHLFFRSSGAMSNLSSPQPINIDSSTPFVLEYFNALGGNVGTPDNPIQINTFNELNVGANRRADFIGTPSKSRVFPILSNYPCIVTFNGVTIIDCTTQPTTASIFNTIPKNLLYVPGIYSSWSWDNLSSDWYFEESPFYLGDNPRDQKLFYLPKKRKGKKVQFTS